MAPVATAETRGKFRNNLRELGAMHGFVREAAIQAGFSNEALGDIELAVVEACANVIKHAYRRVPVGSACFEIQVQVAFGALEIVITDWGDPFDPPRSLLPRPDAERMAAEGRRGGMGIFFMQQLMDEVAWDIRPGQCNRLRMVKKLG